MSRWFKEQRQAWIAEMLDIYGFINREHLQRKFGISEPQASLDLQAFARAQPTAMRYDVSQKCYLATAVGTRATTSFDESRRRS